MVLFLTTNSLSGTLGSPAGWTLLQGKDGTATRGRAWTKQATAADANANVTVTGTTTIKDTMSVGGVPQQRRHVLGHRVRPDLGHHHDDQPHLPLGGRGPGRTRGWSTPGARSPPPP